MDSEKYGQTGEKDGITLKGVMSEFDKTNVVTTMFNTHSFGQTGGVMEEFVTNTRYNSEPVVVGLYDIVPLKERYWFHILKLSKHFTIKSDRFAKCDRSGSE